MQRRCIHDAFGKEDPEKIKQSAIPRPHARKSNLNGKDTTGKKRTVDKQMLPYQIGTNCARPENHSQLLENVLNRVAPVANMVVQPSISQSNLGSCLGASSAATQRDIAERASLLLDPALFWETTVQSSHREHAPHSAMLPTNFLSADDTRRDTTIEGHCTLGTTYGASDAKVEPAPLNSRESFEQPASSLVSPPASSHDDVDSSPMIANPQWIPSRSSSEQSSIQIKQSQNRYTPESGSLRRASNSSSYGEATSEQVACAELTEAILDPKARARVLSEYRADEESLRLIKELQVQEMGLRRRGNA